MGTSEKLHFWRKVSFFSRFREFRKEIEGERIIEKSESVGIEGDEGQDEGIEGQEGRDEPLQDGGVQFGG